MRLQCAWWWSLGVLLVVLAVLPESLPQYVRPGPCERSSCYPATGNLLVGREERLSATSTCGLYRRERYCIVSHLEDRKKCFWCDSQPYRSNPAYSHTIDNIISRFDPSTRRRSWWQSENGRENVSIQLDLEAEFHFTHLIITFRTFRPAAMLIERSFDFGNTWHTYRYFADRCDESFPGVARGPPRRITDVVCESRYSSVAPSTNGEVIFRVLPPSLTIDDPYSQEVQNLLKMTNLRINFTKLHSLGDDLLDNRQEIKEKYYYSIYEMVVRGSCSCYGHASRCLPLPGVSDRSGMVHGRCECTHNTQGLNCEKCEDFYNALPWRPAIGKQTNACQRCECNDHATACHFDSAVYEATGFVSGGVCDNCQHNTMGRNCELCKPFYYKEPSLDIRHPSVCQPCDCDPRGSLDDGICDSQTDSENGLVAGQCHCKSNVRGQRCDTCKNGFWNFDADNPEGCQSCTCNLLGTIGNQGCNVYDGKCTCKRYVTGRNCDQCLPDYWGLSEDPEGCKLCNCDPGGSVDSNLCDVITGQCRCRPLLSGRTCDQPDQAHFTGMMDYYVYEAEVARGVGRTQVVVREPYRDGREATWTGTGFMRVYEGSTLEFDIDNVKTSLQYDIVIRYEPQLSGSWQDLRVVVDRPGPVDPDGECATSIPQDDIKRVQLAATQRYMVVFPPACLERGVRYKIRLEFTKYDTQVDTPSATSLIDSIVLVPRIDNIPFFIGTPANEYRRQEFERFRCREAFYEVVRSSIPDMCRNYLLSIGYYTYDGATGCDCDPTGSLSSICETLGGQCQCKPNVVGRRCDRCAAGTYGFGPEGCTACDCNAVGSLDNFCDSQTGQCKCRPNTYGRQCDECQPGFWNYPNCERCECNGHADTCDSRTGYCDDCRDFTTGPNCAICLESYYGDPRLDVGIACRPCPCPGTIDSGHSFAERCFLEPESQDVVCECAEGYAGPRCDVCADNYFGNPEEVRGSCQACKCNNNIDLSRPGNCDGQTGECLLCLFNTNGFNCDVCAPGYYGDAINQLCRECVCNILGTDFTIGPCDPATGQCPCLPSVAGPQCDRCAPNHWKIASGDGCVACACDPVGSYSDQCNEFDGQCDCKAGFGGRQCDQCETNYWGDPNVECFACSCNPYGSASQQCDRRNGSCVCQQGIGGNKCDECARGYHGNAPYCTACGECFDNWDRILNEMKERTQRLVAAASEIKQGGATGAYTREFEVMEQWLLEVRGIIDNASVSTQDLDRLTNAITDLRNNLTTVETDLRHVEGGVDNVTQRINLATFALQDLQTSADRLRTGTTALKENATRLQEANVEGALLLTREAQRRSQAAQFRVDDTGRTRGDSERQRRRTESLLTRAGEQFNQSSGQNQAVLDDVTQKLSDMEAQLPDVNDQVCDRRGDPCDSLCGGAGCDRCGGLSCDQGAVTKSSNALEIATQADDILRGKEADADEILRGVTQAKRTADRAHDLAQMAFSAAKNAQNQSQGAKEEIEQLMIQIDEFLDNPGAKPSEIRVLAEQVLELSISLRPEQITELARQINETIQSLTNIDAILASTTGDLALANDLKSRADRARDDASGILDTAQRVVGALEEAEEAQDLAQAAIDRANDDIQGAETHLTQIASETAAAHLKANSSLADVNRLKDRLKDLLKKYVKNELDVKEADREASLAAALADRASEDATRLDSAYQEAVDLLEAREAASGTAKDRAKSLLDRATKLASDAIDRLNTLQKMEQEFEQNEIRLQDLSAELMVLDEKMTDYLSFISARVERYRCHS